ncbi:hypothetical protein HPB48_024983 [Haemaphysalis longicornis]|uniref:Uncharacterized protein n=1 Tax=Haemaphysalis longicornis TaxID=44386 RepID=A0A9J6H8Q3_HAELO|nr:hypothetical protein HPB48_024983 [Haemaphysalis longicornis]
MTGSDLLWTNLPPAKFSTSYEELRRQNREEYERRFSAPPPSSSQQPAPPYQGLPERQDRDYPPRQSTPWLSTGGRGRGGQTSTGRRRAKWVSGPGDGGSAGPVARKVCAVNPRAETGGSTGPVVRRARAVGRGQEGRPGRTGSSAGSRCRPAAGNVTSGGEKGEKGRLQAAVDDAAVRAPAKDAPSEGKLGSPRGKKETCPLRCCRAFSRENFLRPKFFHLARRSRDTRTTVTLHIVIQLVEFVILYTVTLPALGLVNLLGPNSFG